MSDATAPHGPFCWYELTTTDDRAAEAFYTQVVGWQARDAGMPGLRYTLLGPGGDQNVAGLMALTLEMKAMGVPPSWTGYVAVADVDAAAARVRELGGAVNVPPQDIPGVGRFAIVADPQGAVFALFKGAGDMPVPPPGAGRAPGQVGWHELHAGSLDGAWPFYEALFGWRKAEAMDMGPMGIYQLLSTRGSDEADGAMFGKSPEGPGPCWLFYFTVASVDAAVERMNALGGKVLMGPHPVPGGQWIVQALDPQGVMFAVVGAR